MDLARCSNDLFSEGIAGFVPVAARGDNMKSFAGKTFCLSAGFRLHNYP